MWNEKKEHKKSKELMRSIANDGDEFVQKGMLFL